MIELNDLIQDDLILDDLEVDSRDAAIDRLLQHLAEHRPEAFGEVDPEETLRAVHEREAMQTTGIGRFIAFPHARIHGWGTFVAVIGVSRKGIDFQSVDGQPVHVICLMISPEDKPYLILKAMAGFSRLFHTVTHPLMLFGSGGEFRDRTSLNFTAMEKEKDRYIIAHDLMRPVKVSVSLNMPVGEVARTMHLYHLDELPVVDDQGGFYGVISCLDIFSFGIPDFFNHLHTVSFVRHIDPFEKYYRIRKDLRVVDLIRRDLSSAILKENTLLEIVFQLTVKKHSKLFILDDGKLSGEIDRFSIVDKILFY